MKTNIATVSKSVHTHEGAVAQTVSPYHELKRTLMTCLLWEDTFYEGGESIANRIAELVPKVAPEKVAELAIEARERMLLRHAPLWLVRQLAKIKGQGPLVASTLERIIQRADELGEFCSLYWKEKRQPLSAGVKRGLARAFVKFDAYQLGKWNQDSAVRLRDVLFLCHAKPKNEEQAFLWKRLVEKTLESPDTWEVELSAGKDKKETWERLLREKKLGGLAVLRNLRNMQKAGVDEKGIRERLADGAKKALPFRFVAAARSAPKLEDAIERAMLASVSQNEKLPGSTLLVIDTSGSMSGSLSSKSEINRIDAAAALAILVREVCQSAVIYATAGDDGARKHATMEVAARHGFALADSIRNAPSKIGGGGIFLVQCMDYIDKHEAGRRFDRVIVLTDEQDCDLKLTPNSAKKLGKHNFVVNMASYKHGVSYGNGFVHIDGWSERILDYVREHELQATESD